MTCEAASGRKAFPMRKTRRVWWKAAGLMLATSVPALAQGVPPVGESLPPPYTAVPPPAAPILPPPMAPPALEVVGPDLAHVGGPTQAGNAAHAAGKHHDDCQAIMWGYAEEFEAPALGATIHPHFRTMVANGEAARMVLYRCDFIEGSNALNLHGRDRLTKIAMLLHVNHCPIIIERLPEAPALAEARRMAILTVLTLNDIPIPPERVVVGPPISYGLAGEEAVRIHAYFLENLRTQGAPLALPSGGAGVSGGSSTTGGGR